MSDTDMSLIDIGPRDPFDFYLDHYQDQLIAGYTKIKLGFGLRVFMRDFNKLPRYRDPRTVQARTQNRLLGEIFSNGR